MSLPEALKIDPKAQAGQSLEMPLRPLGSDYLGRDLLARLMSGARVSLFIGFVAPFLSILIGILVGGISGYFGGKTDAAPAVWAALGDVSHYVEPFCGSAAVLLARPHAPRVETVNDADGMVANFWRAVAADPRHVAPAGASPLRRRRVPTGRGGRATGALAQSLS
jgi:hypothetical protein